MRWPEAAKKYEELYSKKRVTSSSEQKDKDEKKHLAAKIAYCYRQMNDYKKAEKWYGIAVDNKFSAEGVEYETPDPGYFYEYGLILKTLGEYEDAIKMFEQFKKASGDNSEVESQIAFCLKAKEMIENKTKTPI